ncbi:MAG: TIGR01212 family radical SAM protein [Bacteroidales bacterium]|nr:TIGR01212 family radical SAM protein [Bacteroidales bacterium]
MQNKIYQWGHNRRFNAYTNWCVKKFGSRLQKVSLDAGFTCPNRDGTIGTGGCIYCNNEGFNPSYCSPKKTITQQLKEGIEFLAVRYPRTSNYIAYFQAYSNTYAPLEKLKKLYEEALSCEGVMGLSIGTRPDCIDDKKLDYLQKLNEKYFITVEYGVESCYNKTLEKINRGHSFEKSVKAIEKTAKRKINTGIHLIFGLPAEDRSEMLKEAEIISKLPIHSVKFHQLQILKNTPIAEEYKNHPEKFSFFGLDEYIDFIIDFTEKLNPGITIERFTSEVPPRMIAGPNFGTLRTDRILQLIEKRMEKRNTWQGKLVNS